MSALKSAYLYGADACYIGGGDYSLRHGAVSFDRDAVREAVGYAHERGKKLHVAINAVVRSGEIEGVSKYAKFLESIGIDAVIVSDPGVFFAVKNNAPNLPIHISTQANIVNYETASFWYKMGAERVVLARELSLEEIKEIRAKTPKKLEIETFVHGAMCMSHSGRCLLSNYLTERDANHGACAQPCRWKYYIMEEKRPGEYMPIIENDRGTFVFNSKDLCMIEHLPLLAEAGVTSFKIEGRAKSEYYVACVVRAYRKAIDLYNNGKPFDKELLREVGKVSHREYTTGFYFGQPGEIHTYGSYIRTCDVCAVVTGYDERGYLVLEQRNKFSAGDTVEAMTPGAIEEIKVEDMLDGEGNAIDSTPHAQMKILLKYPKALPVGSYLRTKECEK